MMMCESIENLTGIDKSRYIAEEKKDGVRLRYAYGKVWTQNRQSFSDENEVSYKFPELDGHAVIDAVLDIEVVANDDDFLSTASRIQSKDKLAIKIGAKKNPVTFWILDVIEVAHNDVRKFQLMQRKELLKMLDLTGTPMKVLPWTNDIDGLWNKVIEDRKEGIILKRMDSIYDQTKRSPNWLKLKAWKEIIETVNGYEIMPNEKGITLTIKSNGQRLACLGEQSGNVKHTIDKHGFASVCVQYLTKNDSGLYRFPSFRGLAALHTSLG